MQIIILKKAKRIDEILINEEEKNGLFIYKDAKKC